MQKEYYLLEWHEIYNHYYNKINHHKNNMNKDFYFLNLQKLHVLYIH